MTGKFKKTEVQLELLADVNILLMIVSGIKGGIFCCCCCAIYRYASPTANT